MDYGQIPEEELVTSQERVRWKYSQNDSIKYEEPILLDGRSVETSKIKDVEDRQISRTP